MQTELFKLKDKYQREGLNYWAGPGLFRACCEIATGVGKTRMAVLAVEYVFSIVKNPKILIITPTEIIRDSVFPNEFKKWKLNKLLNKIEIQCIQTAYKRRDEHFDLVIADEYHGYLSEQYSLFFSNKIDRILALSAKVPENNPTKFAIANSIAPICYKIDTDRAVELGLISPYIEYNVAVTLTPKEQEQYNTIQGNYDKYEELLGGSLQAYANAQIFIRCLGHNQALIDQLEDINNAKGAIIAAKGYWKAMMERKKFLYEVPSKTEAVKTLIDKLELSSSVIFSQSVKTASTISDGRFDILPYHTKLSKSCERDFNMKSFLDGRTRVKHLSTCKCTEEGMDLPKLPAIIIHSRNSSPKSHIQKRGRCLRFEEGRISEVWNLYIPHTQDWKWLMAAQSTTNKNNIVWTSLNRIEHDRRKNKN